MCRNKNCNNILKLKVRRANNVKVRKSQITKMIAHFLLNVRILSKTKVSILKYHLLTLSFRKIKCKK